MEQHEILKLAQILSNPQKWAEYYIINPDTLEKFEANYVQKLMFGSSSQRLVIRVHRRSGKATTLDTIIHTPDGLRTMADMKVGTVICTPNGETGKVIGVYPQGKKQIYRVWLDDGTYSDVCKDHLWEVYTGLGWKGERGKSKKQFGNKILTTEEINSNLIYCYSNRIEFNYKLNSIEPVVYKKRDLPIDPYLLGVLLGDGHLESTTITSADPEIIERIEKNTGFIINKGNSKSHGKASSYKIKFSDIKNDLLKLNIFTCKSHDKFIPEDYIYSSIEDRLEIIRGLMDTDGSSDSRRKGSAEYCTVSPQLAKNMASLLRSIGCKVRVKESEAGYTKDGIRKITGTRFRLSITIPEGIDIFHLERKKCGGLSRRYLRRTIIKIEKLHLEEMQCIEIDHEDHLFIINDYTPTHNTYALSILSIWAAMTNRAFKVLVLCPDDEKVDIIFNNIFAFINSSPDINKSVTNSSKGSHEVFFGNGSSIKGKTMGTSSKREGFGARGLEGNMIIVDEAAYLSEGDWNTITPIILGDIYKNRGGKTVKAVVSSTPNERQEAYWRFCFKPGTLITMFNGEQIPIERIRTGDRIISCDGNVDEVIKTFAHKSTDTMCKIETAAYPFLLEATSEHPVWAIKNGNNDPSFYPISSIGVGDYLNIPVIKPTNNMFLDYPMHEIDNFTVNRFNKRKDINYINNIDVRRRKTYNKACREIDKFNIAIANKDENYLYKMMRLLGYYLAEGCQDKGDGFVSGIKFTFHMKEKEYISEVVNIINELFPDATTKIVPKEKYGSKAVEVIAWASYLGILFKHLSGNKAQGKRIHPAIFMSDFSKNLLETYWFGDGSLSGNAKTYTTISPQLAKQIHQLIIRTGKPASIRTTQNEGKQLAFTIYEFVFNRKGANAFIKDNHLFVLVRKIEHNESEAIVYNLETLLTHTYIANGFGVHNCNSDDGTWEQIHVPVTHNPDYTEEEIALRKSMSTDIAWLTEWLACFIDSGLNAFKNSDVDAAKHDFKYDSNGSIRMGVKRAMGVDWDKIGAGVNIAIVEWIPGTTRMRLIYRVEVPKGEYTLTLGEKKVIALNEAFKPDHVYIDRGYGEKCLEDLKLYGKANPSSRLHEITKGWAFNQNIDVKDPIDGTTTKKQFKSVMVNNMMKCFEDHCFEFDKTDRIFEQQLRKYQIIASGANSIKTSRKDEHIIDAVGLALYALYENYQDKIKFVPAQTSYTLPALKITPTKQTIKKEKDVFSPMKSAISDSKVYNLFGRGTLMNKEPSRSTF